MLSCSLINDEFTELNIREKNYSRKGDIENFENLNVNDLLWRADSLFPYQVEMDDSIRMHAQILVVENVHFHFSSGPIWTPGAPPIWAETGLIHQLRQRGLEQWVTEQQSKKTRQKARKRKAGREESRNAEKGRNAVIFQGVSVRLTPQQPNHKQALSDSQPTRTWGSRSPGLKS